MISRSLGDLDGRDDDLRLARLMEFELRLTEESTRWDGI